MRGRTYVPWSEYADQQLLTLRSEGVPYADIAISIGRTYGATRTRFYNLKHAKRQISWRDGMAIIPWRLPARLTYGCGFKATERWTLEQCVRHYRNADMTARANVIGLECDASIYLPGFEAARMQISAREIAHLIKYLPPI